MAAEIEYIEPHRPKGGDVLDLDSYGAAADQPVAAAQPPTGELVTLLQQAAQRGASDVHLVAGNPSVFRVNGRLESVGQQRLRGEDIRVMLAGVVPGRGEALAAANDLDCSVSVPQAGGSPARFRLNAYKSQGQWCACLRHISSKVPSLDSLGFPEQVAGQLMGLSNGLVVFTGTTGSGKSSSMAAIIQLMADRSRYHVLTIEEPIEFVYGSRKGSLFSQREVGRDVDTFANGLKFGLRQAPDIILVGETRDRDTAQMVLSAAETGHLVFTTLHTRDAKGALSRFVDMFPSPSQEDVRKQLAMSLRAVISQRLIPAGGASAGRVLATETLFVNSQAEVAIRGGRIETLDSVIQTGRKEGMYTFEDDIQRLVKAGQLPPDIGRRLVAESDGGGRGQTWG